MADKSLFPRLKAQFSSNFVVRNVGGKQLKVADLNHIQAFGDLQSNILSDRFNRLYKTADNVSFNPYLSYQSMRTQLYAEYDVMNSDGIISTALDTLAAESTLLSHLGEVLSIRSSNENIQRILYNLFYDVFNIEFNLPMWIRSMLLYGDHFLKLDIYEKYGITNVRPLSVYNTIREEGMDPNQPAYTRFIFSNESNLSQLGRSSNKETVFEEYEMLHFRYMMDANCLPFGRSYLEPARRVWKAYSMAKEAMLLHRIMRSPEKRAFYVNIGNIPNNEVAAYIENITNMLKKVPFRDEQTGEYNLRFNVQNMLEDFIIPVRGNDQTTKIDTIKGLEYNGIDDVNFLLQEVLSALKIPKALLNYSDELNGKSTLAGLSMTFSKTVEHIQKLIIGQLKKAAMIHLMVQGFEDSDLTNFEIKLTPPSILYRQEQIALLKEIVSLAGDILDKKLLSSDWIYTHLFDMSEDEMHEQRDLIVKDVERAFRYSQIEGEGNDPLISGVSYGTKHDLANIYKANASNKPESEEETEHDGPGRPKKYISAFKTDKHYLGRDPLGDKENKSKEPKDPVNPNLRGGPLALEAFKAGMGKVNVYKKEEYVPTLLTEEHVIKKIKAIGTSK